MESNSEHPFVLQWVWGHQAKIPPINISNQIEKKIYFASGSVGVCYDWVENKQYMLLGHKNDITSIAATPDKKHLVSVDSGDGNALIIWHRETRDIFHVMDCFPQGIISMCFSSDGNKLVTLTAEKPQEINIWDWKSKKVFPDFTYSYGEKSEFQHYITFHSEYSSHFASCGIKTVHFFQMDKKETISAVLDIKSLYDEKVVNQIGDFTQTAFSPMSSLAVTATSRGTIILWGRALSSREKPAYDSFEWYVMKPNQRICIRLLQAMESKCPISFLNVTDSYIVAGTGKSEILYYDENISIKWSMNFDKGHINNISYTYKPKLGFRGATKKIMGKEIKTPDCPLEAVDFIISTVEGYVGYYSVINKELQQLLWGTNHLIKGVAVHPVWPFIYFGDYNGGLQKWNYNDRKLINKEVYEGICSQIELITIDTKGAYTACAMSNGNIVIYDAVCFTAKPCFIAEEILYKPVMINFSPDSQHLLITDSSSNVTHYRLQLLVVPMVYQMMQKDNVPPEEPFWSFGGKTRQHQGRIVDCMFNDFKKDETVYFYTLGEDRFLVQYNISSSKGLDIEISQRIILERKPIPTCMTWYPLYDISSLIAVLSDDGKMRIYSIETEKIVRIVSLPVYDEPIKKIIFQSKLKHMLKREFPDYTETSDVFEYFVFHCSHMIGISKYPIDGNPNTSLGVTSTPSGINAIVPNKKQTFLFTAGSNDSWVFMYEINIMALLEAEREGGDGIDAFKFLFPASCDPDEMRERLKYGVYSLELEMKLMKLGEDEQPILKGEVPVCFLEYILAALGCFVSPTDLQTMLRDIEFESKFQHDGKKTTLTCLDIIKLYVNYRPPEPVTQSKLKETFKNILAFEEDPDQMPRARFIDILSTRGDFLPQNELVRILQSLQNKSSAAGDFEDSSEDESSSDKKDEEETSQITATDVESENMLKKLLPGMITEEVFFQDILCLESAEKDLSTYVLKKSDYKWKQEYPTLEEFVAAMEKNS